MKSLFRGIGWRIFLSFSTLLVILVLLISFLGVKFAQKNALDNAANELRVLSVTLSEQIQKYLKKTETDLKVLGSASGYLDKELKKENINLIEINNFLRGKRDSSINFEDLAIFDLNGNCIAATDSEWIELYAGREPFFINGLKRYGFAEIFEGNSLEKILLVSTPINEGADPRGVLVAQIKLSALYDLIGQRLGLKGTEVYILDSKLRFLTRDQGEEEAQREHHLLDSPLIQHLKDEFWVGKYKNHKENEVLGTATRLSRWGWYLILEKDFSDIEGELSEYKNSLFTATLILLIALILTTVLIAHSITRPLQNLVVGAQRIARGNLKEPIVVPSGLDEITFLAEEFDKMRATVAASQGRLIEQLEESEQRRLENERLAAIGTLASSLAHEIRNPLNALSLLIAQFERSTMSDQSKIRSLDSMRSEISRLDKLVSDILDYAKPLTLDFTRISVKDFFDGLLDFYKHTFEIRNINASLKFYDKNIFIKADKDKLKQAFLNVIQNALEAIEDNSGEIEISVKVFSKNIEIQVKDSGVGISDGSQSQLFDLFFTTKDKGTGLGLSTVRKIIIAHGGSINLLKAYPKGAIVKVVLPLESFADSQI